MLWYEYKINRKYQMHIEKKVYQEYTYDANIYQQGAIGEIFLDTNRTSA